MKSNDWRHKNVAPYTPGNTKILYFFNCLLDGMHTTIPYICDFSRCRLNVRLTARIQPLLRGHKYALFSFRSSVRWQLRKPVGGIWGFFRSLWLAEESNLKGLTFKLLSLCYNNKLSFKHALIHMQINLVPLQHFSC